jgi:DNA-binding NarL/FixJ family response regulator
MRQFAGQKSRDNPRRVGERMPAGRTQILIADDHPLFRDALKVALDRLGAPAQTLESGTFDETVKALAGNPIDLALIDLNMPGMQGLAGLAFLRSEFPTVPVMVVSGIDDPATIRRVLALGLAGYIPKTLGTEAIREAIDRALSGEVFLPPGVGSAADPDPDQKRLMQRFGSLTPQQMRVLMMLSDGLLNKQIAYELGVSEATIKAHVSAILTKLNVDSRTQAVILAAKLAPAT